MFSLEYLRELRAAEIDRIAQHLTPGARVVELGAGTGQQAMTLQGRGFDVRAFDIPTSGYVEHREFPVEDYDGVHIPVDSKSVDVVYTSNVLEHVKDLESLNKEIRRILSVTGYCVHVLPTHVWRAWTTVTLLPCSLQEIVALAHAPRTDAASTAMAFLRALAPMVPRRHGERGNALTEQWWFHPRTWIRIFQEHGFTVDHHESMGLFYTGNMVLGDRLSLAQREYLARALGSACHLFRIRPGEMS